MTETEEKSVKLAMLVGRLVDHDGWNGMQGYSWRQDNGDTLWPLPDLYDPANMELVFRIIQWAHRKAPDELRYNFDHWFYFYGCELLFESEMIEQWIAVCMDKVLELATLIDNPSIPMVI